MGTNGCTTTEQNDGMITGVDSTMEYKTADSDTWIAVTGDSVTDLEPGTYLVRVKGNGTVLASETVEVTIKAAEQTSVVTDNQNKDDTPSKDTSTKSPDTGNDSLAVLFAMLAAAGAGAVIVSQCPRKKKYSK